MPTTRRPICAALLVAGVAALLTTNTSAQELLSEPHRISEQELAAIRRMTDTIQKNWNPNCAAEGARDIQVKVSFKLATDGRIVGTVGADVLERSKDPLTRTAVERAVRAVHQSAPFQGLPSDYYGQLITLNFKARDVCAAR